MWNEFKIISAKSHDLKVMYNLIEFKNIYRNKGHRGKEGLKSPE